MAVLTEPLLNVFLSLRVSADMLSIVALGCSVLAGVAYFFSAGNSLVLALALLFLLLNGLLDGLDGALARKTGTASKYGDFLDHVIDRYADVFIVCGIFLGGYLRADLGTLVITGVLLASYLGTQAQAVGVGRIYGGIMGRADRMVVLMLATCVTIVYPAAIGIDDFRFPVLGWALLLIGVLSHFTALQRIRSARRSLLDGEKK
ncbi:MAG: Bifunctional IPC transferase and DIPP synthase [Methanocella sp. PtaU1.Bin125]|nr:MAG: Bifunctional IPC transferase and DIPP synthase [Methanocella sp. PtaU1.Bin125]